MSRRGPGTAGKIVAATDLDVLLRPRREAGRTVVFTNGCFDLLHAGHLVLLESAAREGDILVVGVNSDNSVRRLKGEQRPVVPFEERTRLLAGFEVVDWVVGFERDTPEELIESLVPDVLVKGGDWAPDRIVGRDRVERGGGRVVTIPLLEGRSTTRLLERIAELPSRRQS